MIKKYKKAVCLTVVLTAICLISDAQNNVITKYFDADWKKVQKDSAFFYTEMVKEDNFYRCTSYWMESRKIYCKSIYNDSNFSKPLGLLLRYYETGVTEDSTYFNEDATLKNTFHYYPNGKLWVHYTYNPKTKKEVTEAYGLKGEPIDDFIFFKEASFQDGAADWKAFLTGNLDQNVPVRNGAPAGTYLVIIRFIVGKDGKIGSAEPETNYGYGMEEEAMRAIKKSPRWSPLVMLGKPVNAYRRQPVTFVISEEKVKGNKKLKTKSIDIF